MEKLCYVMFELFLIFVISNKLNDVKHKCVQSVPVCDLKAVNPTFIYL